MLGKLKKKIKKNSWINPLAHRVYYRLLNIRSAWRNSPMVTKTRQKFQMSSAYPVYCRLRGRMQSEEIVENSRNTWAFNAGNTFTGNPKWLFIYVCRYRKDIEAYWICDDEQTTKYVRSLGYKAYTFNTPAGNAIQHRTGVFCVEQVKEKLPSQMPRDLILLNLYHGVGCKTVEKKVNYGFLAKRIAQKYIAFNDYYNRNMLFLVTSPLMEEHFKKQMDLQDSNLIRAGYPRCIYQKYFEPVSTFDHDILAQRGLKEDTKIAAYVPTYRDDPSFDFWGNAVPDFPRLIARLKELNMLLIFKMHPQMVRHPRYQYLLEQYGNEPHLLFWDNNLDFYEIFEQVDVGIIDYSSIFYDMMAGGTKHFIRYFFDYDQKETNLRDFVFDLEEMTCGQMCMNFEEFLDVLGRFDQDDTGDFERINDLFWKYSGQDSLDQIVDQTLAFEPRKDSGLPVLYSFDIFDTLISRKVLAPEGIFYAVRYRMEHSDIRFPEYVTANYPKVRAWCESNAREYYRKSLGLRGTDRREISFEMIFERMAELYHLTKEQTDLLMQWELDAEMENTIPREREIGMALDLADRKETVFLISDMYLSKDFIQKMLAKADPRLAELPLFLSSDYGVQKTTCLLYLKAYLSCDTYNFRKWIHFGDNLFADKKKAAEMNITPVIHSVPAFNEYEQELADQVNTYDGYLVAADFARFREQNTSTGDYFAYAYVSLYFVPYVYWAIDHALARGIQKLYFISRDGHHLQQIADAIIKERDLPLTTRYIYGSRRAWRVPSFIEDVDREFFSDFGNFAGVNTFRKLLKALLLTEEKFDRFFPGLSDVKKMKTFDGKKRGEIIAAARANDDYRAFILEMAAEGRPIVIDYLRQEIDFSEKFAFVEYWGRGYTQTCFTRLLQYAASDPSLEDIYYYARSIYPSMDYDTRYNFTSDNESLLFVEAIFANIPYKSVEAYQRGENGIEPVFNPADCDMQLHASMERCLAGYAAHYCRLPVLDRDRLNRDLFDFALRYFADHQDNPDIAENYGSLLDAVGVYGEKRQFAPPITQKMISSVLGGVSAKMLTTSVEMSAARSDPRLAKRFIYLTQDLKKEREEEKEKMLQYRKERDELIARIGEASVQLSSCKAGSQKLQELYERAVQNTAVTSLMLIVNPSGPETADALWSLKKEAAKNQISVSDFCIDDPSKADLSRIASAKYIVLTKPEPLFSMISLRQETFLLLSETSAFHFREERPAMDHSDTTPVQEIRLRRYLNGNHFSMVPAAGPAAAAIEKDIYELPETSLASCGAPVTDVYFDPEFREKARKKLTELFPDIAGRKIIVYMPYYRYRPDMERIPQILDLHELERGLSDDFVILYHSSSRAITDRLHTGRFLAGFFKDLTDEMSVRELMVCADILVGDYTDEFYEGTLLDIPMYMTIFEPDSYVDQITTTLKKEEYRIAPVVSSARELIQALYSHETGDHTAAGAFREQYLGYCSGEAAAKMLM